MGPIRLRSKLRPRLTSYPGTPDRTSDPGDPNRTSYPHTHDWTSDQDTPGRTLNPGVPTRTSNSYKVGYLTTLNDTTQTSDIDDLLRTWSPDDHTHTRPRSGSDPSVPRTQVPTVGSRVLVLTNRSGHTWTSDPDTPRWVETRPDFGPHQHLWFPGPDLQLRLLRPD